jgi:hypothetical protein
MNKYIRKLREIKDGWLNHWFDNKNVKELADKRAEICADCPLNVNNICSRNKQGIVKETFVYNEQLRVKGSIQSGCGCPLSQKTKSPDSKCPINAWID